MLVTIIKSSGEKFWYANKIGASFHVLPSVKGKHRIDVTHYPEQSYLHGFFINVEDCLIEKENWNTKEPIKEDDVYSFSCINCDWVFKCIVNEKLNCPYCKKNIITNPFDESAGINDLGTTTIIYE